MTIEMTGITGEMIILHNVKAVDLVGPNTVSVQCFGNEPVIHRGIHTFVISPFVFPTRTFSLGESTTFAELPGGAIFRLSDSSNTIWRKTHEQHATRLGENEPILMGASRKVMVL